MFFSSDLSFGYEIVIILCYSYEIDLSCQHALSTISWILLEHPKYVYYFYIFLIWYMLLGYILYPCLFVEYKRVMSVFRYLVFFVLNLLGSIQYH